MVRVFHSGGNHCPPMHPAEERSSVSLVSGGDPATERESRRNAHTLPGASTDGSTAPQPSSEQGADLSRGPHRSAAPDRRRRPASRSSPAPNARRHCSAMGREDPQSRPRERRQTADGEGVPRPEGRTGGSQGPGRRGRRPQEQQLPEVPDPGAVPLQLRRHRCRGLRGVRLAQIQRTRHHQGREEPPLHHGPRYRRGPAEDVRRDAELLPHERPECHRPDRRGYRPGECGLVCEHRRRARHHTAEDDPLRSAVAGLSERPPVLALLRPGVGAVPGRLLDPLPKFQGQTLSYAPCGYTGPQFRAAYENGLRAWTGKGATVAITDAYAWQKIAKDANQYAENDTATARTSRGS